MILGIDAFNISSGGGLTHLTEFLKVAEPENYGFEKVVVWGAKDLLEKIEDRRWLIKVSESYLNGPLFHRVFWHIFLQKKRAHEYRCNIILCPGGLCLSRFSPAVVISQNMLPFEWQQIKRYGISIKSIKFVLLRFLQIKSFKSSRGIIFLTYFAEDKIKKLARINNIPTTIVPHGISPFFFNKKEIINHTFSEQTPCRVLYTSIISPYKNHFSVVKAISLLKREGYFLTLDLLGPPDISLGQLQKMILIEDPNQEYIFYRGPVVHESLAQWYAKADIGIFASSCENMPIILLECMASGLPMACSNIDPMLEILGNAGEFFNPYSPIDIHNALKRLILSSQLRKQYSFLGYQRASKYLWQRTANQTLKFLAGINNNSNLN